MSNDNCYASDIMQGKELIDKDRVLDIIRVWRHRPDCYVSKKLTNILEDKIRKL